MNSLQNLDVTYTQWKNMRNFLGGVANSYYIQSPEGYTLVLVDLSRKYTTVCSLKLGSPQGQTNITDFETNLKSISVSQSTIGDCVAAAIIGM